MHEKNKILSILSHGLDFCYILLNLNPNLKWNKGEFSKYQYLGFWTLHIKTYFKSYFFILKT